MTKTLRDFVKEMTENYLNESSAIKPYKDWKSLYDEAIKDGEDPVQFILDNTDDDKAQLKGGRFNPIYVRAVEAWVKARS